MPFIFFFFTNTILDNRVRNYTFSMKLVVFKLSTSSMMAFYLSDANILFFFITLLTFRSMFNLWIATLGSSPGMFVQYQANSFLISFSNSVIYATCISFNPAPAKVVFSCPSSSTLTGFLCGSVLFPLTYPIPQEFLESISLAIL